jgi:hypothetical protein
MNDKDLLKKEIFEWMDKENPCELCEISKKNCLKTCNEWKEWRQKEKDFVKKMLKIL